MSLGLPIRNQGVLYLRNWAWSKLDDSDEFWIGTDLIGARWLLKNRGSFYAYREMVFSLFAEELDINVQKSRYLILDAEMSEKFGSSRYELAIGFIEPAKSNLDKKFGPFQKAYESSENSLELLVRCGHQDALDKVKVDMLSHIFGATETSEIFLSEDGRIYIVDNEQMFSSGPTDLLACPWFIDSYDAAMKIALPLCESLCDLLDNRLNEILFYPKQYEIEETWPIEPLLVSSREYVKQFLRIHA